MILPLQNNFLTFKSPNPYNQINLLSIQSYLYPSNLYSISKTNTPKGHIDYMVISWLFYQKGISMPFVAAGENLDMPIVGSLLQASGAFFIRRQFGTDPLYRVVFNEYITQVLQRGYNLEFFMEGGRSRTGKLLTPKMGLFSVVCEAFFNGRLKDAYVVPVWIGYDKVIETEGYIQEMLGRSKPPESLLQLLRAIELLKLNFGSLEVRFSEPYSLKEAVGREMATRNLKEVFLFSSPTSSLSSSSLASSVAATSAGSKSAAELSALALSASSNPSSQLSITRRQLVNVLAYQTMYKINMSSSALPTSLVVTVLLTHEGRGLSKPQLVRRVAWLRDEITKRGGKVCTLQGNPASVIDQVAVLLGSAIGRHNHLLETVYTPLKRFELSYYRNSLIHFFVSESVIACCLYSFRINGARLGKNGKIPKSELMNAAQYLSRLLKHEFIYKPLPDFADTFEECLQWMVHEGIVTAEKSSSASPSPANSSLTVGSQITLQTLSSRVRDDDEESGIGSGSGSASGSGGDSSNHSSSNQSSSNQSSSNQSSQQSSTNPSQQSPVDDILIGINEDNYMFKFLCFLLWPFIECYWMVAASFQGLFPNHMVEEAEFIKSVQKFGETLYYEGELNFYESVSKETTKLALTRFYERKVIVKRVINEKGSAVVHLGEAYTRDEAKLVRFSNKIAQYRRKGKYRTSVGTVDTRAIASLIPGGTKKTKL